MPRYSIIIGLLAVSGAISDRDIPHLKDDGFDAIIDVRAEGRDNEYLIGKNGLKYLHVEIDDQGAPSLKQLKDIFAFAEPILKGGRRILVHCKNGCGRSPLITVSVLVKTGMDVAEAAGLLKEKHARTGFSPMQDSFINTELVSMIGLIADEGCK